MKQIFMIASVAGVIAFFYYLYQRQLGAIPFFLLSIFCFSLARNEYSKRTEEKKKRNGNE